MSIFDSNGITSNSFLDLDMVIIWYEYILCTLKSIMLEITFRIFVRWG